MKILRFISCAFTFLIVLSCSSDDKISNEANNPDDNINIISYKNTSHSEYTDSTLKPYKVIINGEMIDNKYFSFSKETFLGNDLQTSIGGQNYFYQNESLIKRISDNDENDVMHFTQSSDGEIIEVFWELNNRHYNLKFISKNLGHFEKLYENEVISRIIVTFDDNYNIIETRGENINTGELQEPNIFTYTNDNLTGVQLRNGTNVTIGYTDIKNTVCYLIDNSYSKKLRRLICAESYNSSFLQNILSLNHSRNISNEEAIESQFVVSDNGFFSKKTTIKEFDLNVEGTKTVTLEFSFD